MIRESISLVVGVVLVLALVAAAQPDEYRESGPPPVTRVFEKPAPRGMGFQPMQHRQDADATSQTPSKVAPPPPPMGPGPGPAMMMREYAEQLRIRAREAQELADRLRRQADELDQMVKQQMDRGRGPQEMEGVKREMAEIKEAIGRAEREGRRQEAAELRQRASQLMRRFQPLPPAPHPEQRQEIKRQIERLREEARRAKEQGRREQSERMWKDADRLEQKLRESAYDPLDPPEAERQEIKRQIEHLREEARRAKEQGRLEHSERVWQEADRLERKLRESPHDPPGSREAQRQEVKRKIERLREESRHAKGQGRFEEAAHLWKEADRIEQQLREKDEIMARQLPGQKKQNVKEPGPPYKDEVMRAMAEIKNEIGRLWHALNEMRDRPGQ